MHEQSQAGCDLYDHVCGPEPGGSGAQRQFRCVQRKMAGYADGLLFPEYEADGLVFHRNEVREEISEGTVRLSAFDRRRQYGRDDQLRHQRLYGDR